jgi:hypothetical protein
MLNRLDVPSVGRCRKLAGIMGGVKPHAWWNAYDRIGLRRRWKLSVARDKKAAWSAPAYTLGQMLDWARRRGMDPTIAGETLRQGRAEWNMRLYDVLAHQVASTVLANTAPNALADAIIAASEASKKPGEATAP